MNASPRLADGINHCGAYVLLTRPSNGAPSGPQATNTHFRKPSLILISGSRRRGAVRRALPASYRHASPGCAPPVDTDMWNGSTRSTTMTRGPCGRAGAVREEDEPRLAYAAGARRTSHPPHEIGRRAVGHTGRARAWRERRLRSRNGARKEPSSKEIVDELEFPSLLGLDGNQRVDGGGRPGGRGAASGPGAARSVPGDRHRLDAGDRQNDRGRLRRRFLGGPEQGPAG